MRWIHEIRVDSARYLKDPGTCTRTHAGLPCLHVVLPVTVKSRHGLSLNYYLPRLDQVFSCLSALAGGELQRVNSSIP
jgi:hypothetical protein